MTNVKNSSITLTVTLLLFLFLTAFSAPAVSDEYSLSLEIFVSDPNEINVTSVLIMGTNEMMVVSAQGTKSAALRLADTIESKGLILKYIFLTHPHLDHSQGAGILLQRFPEAKFIATPKVGVLQRLRMDADDKLAKKRHKNNAAVPSVPTEDHEEDSLDIDGHTIEIWRDIIGDAGIGYPDEPHVALYIPSMKALLPSDVIYFNAHVMMGGSSVESRKRWRDQIEQWLSMDLDIVVPGHMLKTDLQELTAKGALEHTYQYIENYEKVLTSNKNSEEVIARMNELYLGMQHKSALLIGTYLNFRQMHRLTFNPTIEKVASWLPDWVVNWINKILYKSSKADYNPHQ